MNSRLPIFLCILLSAAFTLRAGAQSLQDLYQPAHELVAERDARATNEWYQQRRELRNGAYKTTGTNSRLVANATNQAGLNGDTSYYSYSSNDRGGDAQSAYLNTGLR